MTTTQLKVRGRIRLLKTISHPVKLMILEELLKGVKCVGDFQDLLEIRQPNVSQHLAALRHHDLVDAYQKGKEKCYYLTKPKLVRDLLAFLERDYPETFKDKKVVCC